MPRLFNLNDSIAGAYLVLLNHSEVISAPPRADHARCHSLHAKMMVNLPARLPPLANLHQGTANAKPVADADQLFGHARCRDVLAKPARSLQQRMRLCMGDPETLHPRGIMFDRIKMHSLIQPAMHRRVAYLIARKAQ